MMTLCSDILPIFQQNEKGIKRKRKCKTYHLYSLSLRKSIKIMFICFPKKTMEIEWKFPKTRVHGFHSAQWRINPTVGHNPIVGKNRVGPHMRHG